MKAKVYFIRNINEDNLVKLYDLLNINLEGNVAVKVHSGEKGNQNFLKAPFYEKIIKRVGGTVVECNTAYDGARNTTLKHQELMNEHGWTKYYKVDILDKDGDKVLDIPNGKIIKENYAGKGIDNYDSMLVVSHFKGHPMGGYGGALKQLSIGIASSNGKAYIHSAGKVKDQNVLWNNVAPQNEFLEAMADAASSVCELFKGKIAFINVMANMSVDCDCCAKAEAPCLKDIGILASLDPVAIDRACLDLVINSNDEGKEHFLERVNSRNGMHILDAAEALGVGTTSYELIEVR